MLPDADWLTLDLVEGVAARRQQTVDLYVCDDPGLHPDRQRGNQSDASERRESQRFRDIRVTGRTLCLHIINQIKL